MSEALHPTLASLAMLATVAEPGSEAVDWPRQDQEPIRRGVRAAYRLTGSYPSPDDELDAIQDAYVRLFDDGARRLHAFRGVTRPELEAYLFRAAYRATLDGLRHHGAKRRGGDWTQVGDADELASPTASPETQAMLHEYGDQLLDAIARVSQQPELDYQIARWALLDGLSAREIQSRLDGRLSATGVETRLHRLRPKLAEQGVTVPMQRSL